MKSIRDKQRRWFWWKLRCFFCNDQPLDDIKSIASLFILPLISLIDLTFFEKRHNNLGKAEDQTIVLVRKMSHWHIRDKVVERSFSNFSVGFEPTLFAPQWIIRNWGRSSNVSNVDSLNMWRYCSYTPLYPCNKSEVFSRLRLSPSCIALKLHSWLLFWQ